MAVNELRVKINFDDGASCEVVTLPRDIARLEEVDASFAASRTYTTRKVYAVAWLALRRLARKGETPEGVTVPDTFDAFLDVADCEVVTSAPKATPRKVSTGSSRRSPSKRAGRQK